MAKATKPVPTPKEAPVIKVRDLSWPLRTWIILAGVGGAIIILYLIFALVTLAMLH